MNSYAVLCPVTKTKFHKLNARIHRNVFTYDSFKFVHYLEIGIAFPLEI